MGKPSDYQRNGYFPSQLEPPRKKPKQPRRRINLARLALLVGCVAVFCFCAYKLIDYFGDIGRSRQSTAELSKVYAASATEATEAPVPPAQTEPSAPAATEAPTQSARAAVAPTSTVTPVATSVPLYKMTAAELWPTTYAKNPRLTISGRFLDLLEKNKDIVGWLTIDGLVNEPVVKRDNQYYLTRNASGQKSVTGALFLDESCDLRTVCTQLVVHGHNMKEGAMFGSLKKYKVKNASFYHEHPYITFNTLYEDAQYVIFAVLEVDVRYGNERFLPYWVNGRFDSAEAFDKYIAQVKALSHYRCGVDVIPGDRLLTLSTCTGTDENERLLVMARKLRDGEDMLKLKTAILTTSDRLGIK